MDCELHMDTGHLQGVNMDDKPRRTRSIERLAASLQDCFDAAVEEGALRTEKRMNERMD